MTEAIADPQVLQSSASRSSTRAWIAKSRGTLVAIGVLVAAILVFELVNPKPFSYFDLSTVTGTAGGLALAGIGETIVVIAGGLDLSVGAVISLVNVLLVTLIGSSKMSIIPYTFLATVPVVGCWWIGRVAQWLFGWLPPHASNRCNACDNVHNPGVGLADPTRSRRPSQRRFFNDFCG